MKEVINILMIALLAMTAVFQTIRLLYLAFEPAFLKHSVLAKPPGKITLILYALLTILVCLHGIQLRAEF